MGLLVWSWKIRQEQDKVTRTRTGKEATGLGCLLPSALSNDEEQRYRKPKECESETTVRWCVRVEDRRGNRPRGGSVGHSVVTGHAVNWKLEEAAAGGRLVWWWNRG